MISLPNGCSRSEFTIIPDNWNFAPEKLSEKERAKLTYKAIKETTDALLKKEWRIVYRFYDPVFKDTKLWGKQIPLKGMNKYKTLSDRQEFTTNTLAELDELLKEGYNPITKKIVHPEIAEIDSNTPFAIALTEAHKKLKCAQGTKDDIERALVHMQAAITALNMAKMPVAELKIRECIMLLNKVRDIKLKKRDNDIIMLKADFKARKIERQKFLKELKKLERYNFGASSFNHYRCYLIMLFNVIVPLANMAGNPVEKIPKEKEIKKIRDVLTDDQRKLVNDYLHKSYYEYWRFLQIFFHSGARITEILRVEPKHVDLKNQRFKALILKGAGYEEVWKVIKTIALPYWQEAMRDAALLQSNGKPVYLFSKNQKPGFTIINEQQIGRRWRERVKHKPSLGNVTADFYALKHLNSTETRTIAGAQAAAAQNSHKSTAMVVNIYDVKRDERVMEDQQRLKEVNNPFA
jgi:integrase